MRILYAILVFLFGVSLAYWVKKRKFERTSSSGAEVFKTYSQKVFVTAVEKTAWVVALVCMTTGAVLIAF